MARLWPITVVGVPPLAGLLLAVALRRARPLLLHRLVLLVTGLTVLLALVALLFAGEDPVVVARWPPGTGEVGLLPGSSSLCAVLVTTGAAFVVLLGSGTYRAGALSLSSVLLLPALGAANFAFLTDHFLGRYAALEIVALCVALAPLVERRGAASGVHLSWRIYLLLRLGDAGLLVAILALRAVSGTLSITPALRAGAALEPARLAPAAGGLVLAAWIKLGAWPFGVWSRTGRRLSPATHAWLYGTLVPNLGAYLLYRATPLVAAAGPLQMIVLWAGACAALAAMLVALRQRETRSVLIYTGSAWGGLALCLAAAGGKSAVWLGPLLVLTPLRLLLFLSGDASSRATSTPQRRVAVAFHALGGIALVALGVLTAWWVWAAGVPPVVSFVVEVAVGLMVVCLARTARRLWRSKPASKRRDDPSGVGAARWTVLVLLAGTLLAAGGVFVPLAHLAASVTRAALPLPSAFLDLSRLPSAGLATLLALLIGIGFGARQDGRWWRGVPIAAWEETSAWQDGLFRVAQVLHDVIEVGLLERVVRWVWQDGTFGLAQTLYRAIEAGFLEQCVRRTGRVVTDSARATYDVVEQAGLEGILRGGVRVVLAASRTLQRWHTGRLRRNLLWLPAVLTLALLALAIWGWRGL